MKKLLSVLLIFVLMFTITACGNQSDNWEQTLEEFGTFIDEFMEASLNALNDSTDKNAKTKLDAKQKELNLWQDKIDKLSEKMEGTAEEEAYKKKLTELYTKLMQNIVNSNFMDKAYESLEDKLDS